MGFVVLVDCRGGGRILQWVLFSWSIVAMGEEFCSCQFLFVAVASVATINKGLLLPMTPSKIWIMGKACHFNDTPGGGYTK